MRLVALVLAFLLTGCATMAPQPVRFRLLQINDVYKVEGLQSGRLGGMARIRTLREQLESDGTPVFIVHAGDALYPSVMSKYLEARPMIDVMNLLDGDAELFDPALLITFGNHEFDNKDVSVLPRRLAESKFPWVSTNVLRCAPECDRRFPGVEETIVREVDGVRIGFFGLTLPLKKPDMQSTDVKEAARAAVANLRREGARVIVAITHQERVDDLALVRDVPGIDFVIGGHNHMFMQTRIDGTWITKADADAKSVVVYDVVVPPDGRARAVPLRVVLDETIPKDEQVDARVQEWLVRLAQPEVLGPNENIATTKNLLEGVETAIRGRETALGNLITDAVRARMGTDIAVINGGSIRINDDIVPGPITKYDMEGIFNYKNKLVAFRVTGQQLLDMLRNSVSQADDAAGRFLQVSGMEFSYRKVGEGYVVEPRDVEIGERMLDVNATYTVASTDYLYLHGADEDEYMLFATDATRPPKVSEDMPDFRTTVEEYIRARGKVDVNVEDRIVRR
ncbi:MAG TPA: bifunctional UDP-sugar hydrolase/5'-nucleotidase [Thermoanaerobaculia bacterium]|nr:bifunctional UDP-sugar hydrolase/5'-nucleotidase [Thermoanaerobaculia bacterium]